MAGFRAIVTDDVAKVVEEAGSFLRSDPVQHNLILTLLEQRCAQPESGRYGVVSLEGEVVGVSFQSPLAFHASITPMPVAAIEPLVDELADVGPELPGVSGAAAVAARFAGRWAELLKVPAVPVEGQRLYELRVLQPPVGVPGELRAATSSDLDLIVRWAKGFEEDTGSHVPMVDVLCQRMADGLTRIWDDDGPVSMAGFTVPIGRVSRIGHVYTPSEHRGRGYAAACTAAISQVAFDSGADRCILYTQLSNPTSNAIYRRLGYESVGDQVRYSFTPRAREASTSARDRSAP
jgi:predicted GNAT family acetyltransferase